MGIARRSETRPSSRPACRAGRSRAAADAAARASFDVAVSKIDGAYKVAVEKCEALIDDARKACKDKADSDFEAAMAREKATLAGKM